MRRAEDNVVVSRARSPTAHQADAEALITNRTITTTPQSLHTQQPQQIQTTTSNNSTNSSTISLEIKCLFSCEKAPEGKQQKAHKPEIAAQQSSDDD